MTKVTHKVKCPLTKYEIVFTIDDSDNSAYILEINTDYKLIKPFFALLRNSMDELKEKGVVTIRQSVYIEEYEKDLKRKKCTWKIAKTYCDQTCDLECDIDDYTNNYIKAVDLF